MNRRLYVALMVTAVLIAWVMPVAISGWVGGWVAYQVVGPALWFLVGVAALILFRNTTDAGFGSSRRAVFVAVNLAVVHVLVYMLVGVITGVGRSPYSLTITGVTLNAFFLAGRILGMELSRTYLLRVRRDRFVVPLVATTLLFTIVELQPSAVTTITTGNDALTFFAARVLPTLAENLLLSLLAFTGGSLASIAYRAVLESYRWFFPLLPALAPIAQGLVSAITSIILLLVLAAVENERLPADARQDGAPGSSWQKHLAGPAIGVACVLLIWFASGALGPRPLVVVSGSMRPAIEVGDIIVATPVEVEDVRAGDVIAFKTRSGVTIHRVVRVVGKGDSRYLVTKGDANPLNDREAVLPNNLIGRTRIVVPWIGWATIKIRQAASSLTGTVQPEEATATAEPATTSAAAPRR